jgi:23S rRNA pseudouridine2605 synthase
MPLLRLQKFLSQAGYCSRREGERLIQAGQVSVNGEVVRILGSKIDPEKDRVVVNGEPIQEAPEHIYIVLHKPRGVVTSCDHPGEKVVLDLIDIEERVYPVGRLDKDSEGLLLLTNDGRLHHRMSHPSFNHEKEYEVIVDKPLSNKELQTLERGVPVLGRKTRAANIQRLSSKRFRIVLKEGRNRQIRRMLQHLGHNVVRLKRVRMANVRLDRLEKGAWRYLTKEEEEVLLKML